MRWLVRKIIEVVTRLHSGSFVVSNSHYERQVQKINALQTDIKQRSDVELQRDFLAVRNRVQAGLPLDRAVIEVFAIIKDVARRTVDLNPYDVQLLAALAIFDQKMVEMQTGEGKTLAAVLPASLCALTGRGVHVLTFNDYLAARDATWMGPIYQFLGLSVGHVAQGMSFEQRKAAYGCDVTYATAKEAGFDFLRDQVCADPDQIVQRGFHFAIVDEADSILVDEARVPLVIAGPTNETTGDLYRVADAIRSLRPRRDYNTSSGWRSVSFNPTGLDRLQHTFQCGELYSESNVELFTRLSLALHADVLMQRDVDYLVRDGAIELIDEFTGRVAENRRWPYGLQAAIEAKEGLTIRPQGRILNSITLQHFLTQYERLSGMTGTAQEAAEELNDFYELRTVVVPPNRPCIRHDRPDRVFPTKDAKFTALIHEISKLHAHGCPVLVGTASVEESEILANRLAANGCRCEVLNARNDRQESALIAEAGAYGAITISTNMAGRGTDIRLGGSDERDRNRVIQAGGLHVIGTNRHESRRIDNQLRGRSGRQGDPGESSFFISLEDDLIRRHGIGDLIADESIPLTSASINNPRVGRLIAHVQRVIEGESFEIRRTLRKYSFCLEQQRQTIHEWRRRLLLKLESPTFAREHDPGFYEKLISQFGISSVEAAERQITIWHIDRCWSNHLAQVAEIRDQIHLIGMGGLNPLDEFNHLVTKAFREVFARIKKDVLDTLKTIRFTTNGIDLTRHSVVGPSSTWTYMINDNPMGNIVDRFNRKLKQALKHRYLGK